MTASPGPTEQGGLRSAPLCSELAQRHRNQIPQAEKSYISLNKDGDARAPKLLFLLLGKENPAW